MTILYVANTSKQYHQFLYRRPESLSTVPPLDIPPGQQRALPDLAQAEVDYIIAHHARYGMVPAKEAAKVKRFVGLCYSIDKPVSEDSLEVAYHHNDAVLKAVADVNRQKTAVAIADTLEKSLNDIHSPVAVGRVEVEVAEDTKIGQTQSLNEGVEVVKEGVAPRRRSGRPRKS